MTCHYSQRSTACHYSQRSTACLLPCTAGQRHRQLPGTRQPRGWRDSHCAQPGCVNGHAPGKYSAHLVPLELTPVDVPTSNGALRKRLARALTRVTVLAHELLPSPNHEQSTPASTICNLILIKVRRRTSNPDGEGKVIR